MRRILAGIVLALMLTGGVAAGPWEDGLAVTKKLAAFERAYDHVHQTEQAWDD
jgi:hypothetical protein